MLLLGADVGGTFTDLVLTSTDSNQTWIHKVPSTPSDPAQGVLDGVTQVCAKADVLLSDVSHIYHGTTVATNAALQHKGAKAGLITTRGFRDILHIGRHQRPQHYSIQQDIPWQDRPLVPRRNRKVVSERLAPPDGSVVTHLDEDEVREAARELAEERVEAIAVCFLFSYLNPIHEQRAKTIIQETCPDVFVTCSHEVSPQFREFERFTTTAMNAFIGPLVRDYVSRLAAGFTNAGFSGEMHIMRSNGGVASAHTISDLPAYTLMSGLAAGVLGGAWIGSLCNITNLITLDIGGTSADIGVITNGRFSEASARDTTVAGYPILIPMIDLHTIGAGGGSIARVDEAGAFNVGPRSAGAVPGPAAYGNGGVDATVTDANIVLGRLDTSNFLGGEMPLDAAAARQSIQSLATRLNLSLEETAEGVVAILNANMANAIRARTIGKGIDPRQYALVASGGAGPLHGVEVARLLDIPEVIVPPHPGINSAKGLLTTDLKYDIVQTSFINSADLDPVSLNNQLADMQNQLESELKRENVDPSTVRFERSADARYVGQGYELRLPLPDTVVTEDQIPAVMEGFDQLHLREYGRDFAGSPIELVNLRVTATGWVPKIGVPETPAGKSIEAAVVRTDTALFRQNVKLTPFQTRFYQRDLIPVGESFRGPAVILQTDSTTVLPPGCHAQVNASGCLIIKLHKQQADA